MRNIDTHFVGRFGLNRLELCHVRPLTCGRPCNYNAPRFTQGKNYFVRYNVAHLLKEPVGSVREHYVDEEVLLEVGSKARVKGYLRLIHLDRGIWVRGELETEVSITCSRCLMDFSQSIKSPVSEEFRTLTSIKCAVIPPAFEFDEGALTLSGHHILDLGDTVRQALIINEPMKPLCRTDCNGLCSICGGDKNFNICRCEVSTVNSKLAHLADLLTQYGE